MTITQDLMDRIGIGVPILLAPMAGPGTVELAIAVSEAGGLGGLPCAMSGPDQVKSDLAVIRQRTSRPINVNFFCHTPPAADEDAEQRWRTRLAGYYRELGLDPEAPSAAPVRRPFNDETCAIIEEAKPRVVSFHFGLPDARLLARVKAIGALVLSSATTSEEARWLERNGCDAIIAQGYEAGGHRGMFLTGDIATQAGTLALVPQVVDAVSVPVIAAGGISDARGIAAALALGAAAVQIGSAYLHCPEAKVHPGHRAALAAATDNATVLTNVFSGRPSRGIVNRFVREVGPIAAEAPPFPLAANAGGPLRAAAEAAGSTDFSPLWAGQAAGLGRALPAGEVTRRLAVEAEERLKALGGAAWGGGS